MSKNKQQELLEVLNTMSAVAAEILKKEQQVQSVREDEVERLLSQLKASASAK